MIWIGGHPVRHPFGAGQYHPRILPLDPQIGQDIPPVRPEQHLTNMFAHFNIGIIPFLLFKIIHHHFIKMDQILNIFLISQGCICNP